MKRRQFLTLLPGSALALTGFSLVAMGRPPTGDSWTLLTATALKPGASRIKFAIDEDRTFLSGFKLAVDGNRLMVRDVLLHRGQRSMTKINVNRELLPGDDSGPIFPKGAPYLVKAISVDYEVPAGSSGQTVVQVWIAS